MSLGSKIISTGIGLPERVMKNVEFESFLDTSDEWIRTRTGIETRRIVDPAKGENTLSLCTIAAQQALERASLRGEDLGLIVTGTLTMNTVMPTNSNQIQAAVGAHRAFSFDLQAACSGFVYGLSVADHFIRAGTVKHALVIGAETLSIVMDWTDRGTSVLFGDAAGCVVLGPTEDEHRVLSTKLYSDGRYGDLLCIPHGYGLVPPNSPKYRSNMHKIKMAGKEIFKLAVRNMNEAVIEILAENNKTVNDVDFFIFHQANIRIVDACMKTLNVDRSKTWINLDKYGNTSAATLPVCLDEAIRANAVRRGDLVAMVTFGGGLTWGATLVRL